MCKILCVLFLIVASSNANAEPSSAIKYLMKEPVSLLEWGMFNLENHIKTFKPISEKVGICYFQNVEYDATENIVIIHGWLNAKQADKDEIIKLCEKAISTYKTILCPMKIATPSGLYCDYSLRYFSHNGWKSSSEPGNLFQEIEKITNIYIKVNCPKNDKNIPDAASSFLHNDTINYEYK